MVGQKKKPSIREGLFFDVFPYFLAGAAGCFSGLAGCVCVVLLFTFDSTDVLCPDRRTTTIDNVIDVTMKITADQVVALERAVAAPRGPNAVWLPIPPKAAAMSPLFPLCSNTTMIRNKQTIM